MADYPLYVTSDLTRWDASGIVSVGRPLDDYEIDRGFWALHLRITTLENIGMSVGIASVSIAADILTVTLTDHSFYDLRIPLPHMRPRGEFHSGPYVPFDTFSYNGTSYMVAVEHTAVEPFDPGANDGGDPPLDLYIKILDQPTYLIPVGGGTGQDLTKASDDDFDLAWIYRAISNLHDTSLDSDLSDGDHLVYASGFWRNQPLTLPAPTSGTLGGVELLDPVAGEFVTGLDSSGNLITSTIPASVPVETVQDVASHGGALTIDRTLGRVVTCTLTENITEVDIVDGDWFTAGEQWVEILFLTGAGGYTVTGWNGGGAALWAGGTAPTITATAGRRDRVRLCTVDAGSYVGGYVIYQNAH